jgi:serine protease Do
MTARVEVLSQEVSMSSHPITVARWAAVLALAVAMAAGATAGVLAYAGQIPGAGSVRVAFAPATEAGGSGVSFASGFAPIVEPLLPAVVNVSSSKTVRTQGSPASPFFDDPFFRQFFGDQFGRQQAPREQREHSLGSGVIVSADGYILTNNHVVDGASEIKVALQDRREFQAKLIGRDAKTDIAVLKIQASGLNSLVFGDSSKTRIGEFVIAIGDPFGIGETVTMGIVSAKGRGNLDIEDYEDFIQTDAAINPGNSGGALINVQGDLIGINTAIISGGSGGNQGVGFAIPINMAKGVMQQIIEHGKVVRGYLGLLIQPVTPALAKAFGLSGTQGALVGSVVPDGPAARAGIAQGDVILAINGKPVNDSQELRLTVAQMAPGTEIKLKLVRGGGENEVAVKLGELPEKAPAATGGAGESGTLTGVQVEALTPQVAHQLGVDPGTRGVVVSAVADSSPAADVGLRRGDVIEEVDRKPVASVTDFERASRVARKGSVLLLINRRGNTSYVVVEPQ